jgi:hypothetical protein
MNSDLPCRKTVKWQWSVTELWHSQYGGGYYIYYSFLPWYGSKAVIIQEKVCSVKNASDWSLVRSFPVNFVSFSNADFNYLSFSHQEFLILQYFCRTNK